MAATPPTYRIDRHVLDSLMRDLVGHDRRPSAYIVYLAVTARSSIDRRSLSYSELSDLTGLSRRAVQDAVAHLVRRKLIEVIRVGPTEAAIFHPLTPWRSG